MLLAPTRTTDMTHNIVTKVMRSKKCFDPFTQQGPQLRGKITKIATTRVPLITALTTKRTNYNVLICCFSYYTHYTNFIITKHCPPSLSSQSHIIIRLDGSFFRLALTTQISSPQNIYSHLCRHHHTSPYISSSQVTI